MKKKKIASITKDTPPNILLSMALENVERIKHVAMVVELDDGTTMMGYSDMGNEALAYLLAVFQHKLFTVMSDALDD